MWAKQGPKACKTVNITITSILFSDQISISDPLTDHIFMVMLAESDIFSCILCLYAFTTISKHKDVGLEAFQQRYLIAKGDVQFTSADDKK